MDSVNVESRYRMLGNKPRLQELLCEENGFAIKGDGIACLSQRLLLNLSSEYA